MQSNPSLLDDSIVAMFRELPEDMVAYINWIIDQELDAHGLDSSSLAIAPRPAESSSPRRRQESTASSREPSSSPPSLPCPPHPGAWDRGRACVVNATNTYWSYGRGHSCSQESKGDLVDGERVYMKKPDGSYHWAVFKQQARSTLAAKSQLDQMVEAVGGDPASFRTRLAKADYILAREAPTGVACEEDEEEMFSVSFPVHLGQPASGFFWGVGQLGSVDPGRDGAIFIRLDTGSLN